MNIYGESTENLSEREIRNNQLALDAAKESFVLLKNDNALPLKESRVALFGNGARKTLKGGTGSGSVNNRGNISIEEGLEKLGIQIESKKWLDDYDKEYQEKYQSWHDWVEENGAGDTPNDVIFFRGENPFRVPQGRAIQKSDVEGTTCSTAIYVISRQAGEGKDRSLEKGDYFISDEEMKSLKFLSESFDKLVLILNVGGMLDLSIQEQIRIDGIIHFGQAGQRGGEALAEVLTGKDNFSGKLTQTWAKRYEDYPYAMEYSHLDGDLDNAHYKEGIFVGYRYFDTLDIEPLYPFGYGLSYTEFSYDLINISQNKSDFTVTIQVNNIGDHNGKEVVQLYLNLPKSNQPVEFQKLVSYKKSDVIKSGSSEQISLSFELADFGYYDETTASWLLDAGKYNLMIGTHSRDTQGIAEIAVDHQIVVNELTNQFETTLPFNELSPEYRSKDIELNYDYTFKVTELDLNISTSSKNSETKTDDRVEKVLDDLTDDELIQLVIGGGVRGDGPHIILGAGGKTSTNLEHKEIKNIVMADGPAGLNVVNSVLYTEEGKQLPLQVPEQYNFGVYRMMAEKYKQTEGQRSYRYATAWPSSMNLAQTWNEELLYSVGKGTGEEMLSFGITLWLAPGMNIQKNPLCGRNFEYFSEDPIVSGICASAMTRGVQSNPGIGVTIKHYAVNNQEANRVKYSSNVSERALREIYLKGFKLAVKQSKPLAVMTSYNKLNGVYTPNSKALCTNVLRNEWGFDGVVMTDWNSTQGDRAIPSQCIKAGNDLLMPGTEEDYNEIKQAYNNGEITKQELRLSASRVLRVILASAVYS